MHTDGGVLSDRALIERARSALETAYVPYSEYRVGAALETIDGAVYTGCNVENANYSNSIHAEEAALAAAVSDGHREFVRIAVASGPRDAVTPCGMCRQSLAEFCDADFRVLCDGRDGIVEYTLEELLPAAISGDTLDQARAEAADETNLDGDSTPESESESESGSGSGSNGT